jgi:hypothetical protein
MKPVTCAFWLLAVTAVAILACGLVAVVRAESQPLDAGHSTVTVHVSKSGLFSAFADNHTITAPLASGVISETAPLGIELTIRAAELRVLDPDLSADKRSEIQARMLGPEVLDVEKFPDISFASSAVEAAGPDRWSVTGRLTIHGRARTITFPVTRMNGRYRGRVAIKQRDFGIEPIKVAGGTVRVKDELTVDFDVGR